MVNRNTMISFVIPSQLQYVAVSKPSILQVSSNDNKCTRRRRSAFRTPHASQTAWTSQSSSALDYDKSSNVNATRYIDLRTMKVVLPEDAHIDPAPPTTGGFSILGNLQHFNDPVHAQKLHHLLFTSDTLPLSDTQKDVVRALLTHRSVLYTSVSGDERQAIFLDIVMRTRVWKQCVVYSASSRRSAEIMYTTLCAQLGPERRGEVLLNLGDGFSQRGDGSASTDENFRVVITSPTVLRNAISDLHPGSWFEKVSVLFVDDLNDSTLRLWEEILLSVPSNVLLCLMSSHMTRSYLELLPIWMETIQNATSVVSPLGPSSILNRIERPRDVPLLRTFAYNAAIHQSPVQVSLVILKEMLLKEIDNPGFDSIPDYAESFLHGITMIPAEDPAKLLFKNAAEAAYADVSALIVADAQRTETSFRTKHKGRNRTRRKERTPAAKAAMRKRREAAYADSLLLPAIVLIKGHDEVVTAAHSVFSALGLKDMFWDEDVKEQVENVVNSFKKTREDQLTSLDVEVLDLLIVGIGVVNDVYTPSLRLLVEELFRGGWIPILLADTFLGSNEISALPTAKSVLVESSSLAICDDMTKGLILASTAASLAGRPGRDDVGNLVFMWYDESADDEFAGHEIASALLSPELITVQELKQEHNLPHSVTGGGFGQPFGALENLEARRGTQSIISLAYDSVLRALRRFGLDGYESLQEYTLGSFKGWLKRAALHATLEKMEVEKGAIDERLNTEDWDTIADFERKASKLNEVRRILNAMTSRLAKVTERKVVEELRISRPGRIIGVKSASHYSNDMVMATGSMYRRAKIGTESQNKDDKGVTNADEPGRLQLTRESSRKFGNLSSAVFVTLFDQEAQGKQAVNLEHRYLVVCILVDGTWTMVPVCDVEAITVEEDALIPNTDLLVMPHPATFDVQPGLQMAKCAPVDETEQAALHRVSDELITRLASEEPPHLVGFNIPEFEEQNEHMRSVESAYQQSPWYGRDMELTELKLLRRRTAELKDEMDIMKRRKQHFEKDMVSELKDYRSIQSSLMAVLEDCHALSFLGDTSVAMTPIGTLASTLPCEHPVFTAACTYLIDDIDQLSPSQFVAFVAIVASPGRLWSQKYISGEDTEDSDEDDDEPFDIFTEKHDQDVEDYDESLKLNQWDVDRRSVSVEAERLSAYIPLDVSKMVIEIQHALHQLHRRHLEECQAAQRVWVDEIVPTMLNHRLAQAASNFVDGGSWQEVSEILGNEGGYAVREMRRITNILEYIWTDEKDGEFPDNVRDLAARTFQAMNRWPIHDISTINDLLGSGVVEKAWNGNTYDKWWRSVRDSLKKMSASDGNGIKSDIVQSAEAEIVES